MKNIILNLVGKNADLCPIFVGSHDCGSGHNFGPFIRDHCIIHIVSDGKGVLHDKYGKHEIKAGELFIIRRGEVTTYTADKKEPWHYMWIAFTGAREKDFDTDRSVYTAPKRILRRLCELVENGEDSHDAYTALLYDLAYELFSHKTDSDNRLEKLRAYIDYSYMEEITVDSLSRSFGFERSYLYRAFKKKYGVGVKEYITAVRIERARQFLTDGMTVAKTALLVGYPDEFCFSRAFKTKTGISPSSLKPKK